MVEELEILGIELILRAHAQGKSWKHLVPSDWTEEQVERVITLVTGQPDYKPRTERIPPAHQRWHALLDLYPDDLPANRYQVAVGCPVHGRISFDSRQLRDSISHARKRIRFVVPPLT